MEQAKKKETENSTPLWTKDFVLTTLSNFFLFFSFQLLIPTLPAYTEKVGGDAFAVGLVIGIFTIATLFTRPFAGRALDTNSRGKVLLVGLIVFLFATFSYNFAATVLLILIIRFIHGIGWGITTTSFGTIISDIIPQKRRGEGMGYYGLSSTLAMAIGPVIGIKIMYEKGFTEIFFLGSLLIIITIFISRFIKYPKSQNIYKDKPKIGIRDLYEKDALFPSALILIFTITYGGIVTFITLYGQEINIENVGWFFTANAIMVLITRPVAGVIFDRSGHKWLLLFGGFSAIISLILLSYTTNIYMLILSAIFYGMGFGTVQPSLQAWTINRVTPERRGAANGTYFSAFDIGIGTGSILLGVVARATSYSIMYRMSILFIVAYLFLCILFLVKQR